MRDYLETFFSRKWLFFVPFLLVLVVAIAGGIYISWQYQVEARMWIEPGQAFDQTTQQAVAPSTSAEEEFSRLSALIQTDDFLGKVVDSVPALAAQATTLPDKLAQVTALRRNLVTWPTEQKLITFRYRARDPQVAQLVVSNTMTLFLEQRYQDRVATADSTLAFWQARYDELQTRLGEASAALGAWESAHPPATRADLPQIDQLEYQRLRNDYDAIYTNLQEVSTNLEAARFASTKALAEQNTAYVIMDPPLLPESPDLTINRLASIVLVGLAVAAGLGFTVVALATWFGGRRAAAGNSSLPAWLDRMMAQEEQTA